MAATGTNSSTIAKRRKGKIKKSNKKVPIVKPPMKSRRQARRVTSKFHQLTTQLEELKHASNEKKAADIRRVEKEIEELGGREAYQDASILSTKLFRTSKWVFQQLTSLDLRPKKAEPPLKVLEVGAINTQLVNCPWLDVRAIDLQSRDPKIEQRDYFTLKPDGSFDVLVSSMVINCVPTAPQRGLMLQMYWKHLKTGGILFLMLPLLCLNNATLMTHQHFENILKSIGFSVVETKESPKVAFYCLKKEEREHDARVEKFSQLPKPFRVGRKRSTFAVTIESKI